MFRRNWVICLLLVFSFFFVGVGCKKEKKLLKLAERIIEIPEESEEAKCFTAHTGGIVSSKGPVEIIFRYKPDESTQNLLVGENTPIVVKPKFKFSTEWKNEKTLIIVPEKSFPDVKKIKVSMDMRKLKFLVPEGSEQSNLKSFSFSFRVAKSGYYAKFDLVEYYNENGKEFARIGLEIHTYDRESESDIEEMVKGLELFKGADISWQHFGVGRVSRLTVENILRGQKSKTYSIFLDGKSIGSSRKYSHKYEVKLRTVFQYSDSKVAFDSGNTISISFTAPIDEKQDLKGLVNIEKNKKFTYRVKDNFLELYLKNRPMGKVTVTVNEALRAQNGEVLGEDLVLDLNFPEPDPAVRFVGKGGVLPSANKLIIPFEAVNMAAVDVTVVRVYEDNVVDFLRYNSGFQSVTDLKLCGRPILMKTIPLYEEGMSISDLKQWRRFSLDLKSLVRLNKGALYQVMIDIRQCYSLYGLNKMPKGYSEEGDPFYSSGWDYGDREYYSYWYDRDDPKSRNYYSGGKKSIQYNFVPSDLGVILKGNDNQQYKAFALNLNSATPISGVRVSLYNFQNQEIISGFTNGEGECNLILKDEMKGKPHVLTATKGRDISFMRIADGDSLSVSNFDIGGQKNKKGVKGFIYGERGVWRPGDPVHLSFILEDKNHILPDGLPVVFEIYDARGEKRFSEAVKNSVGNLYAYQFKTDSDDPTGDWKCVVEVGGFNFSKGLKIETVKPNRLKIDMDFKSDMIKASQKSAKVGIDVRWLHGAPAGGLKTSFESYLLPINTTFKDFKNYEFDDPAKEYYPARKNIFSGSVDAKGHAEFPVKFNLKEKAAGKMRAYFLGKVFEKGGDFSIDSDQIDYSPYASYVGLELPEGKTYYGSLYSNETHQINLATLSETGEKISRDDLEIHLYKIEWRWWWQNDNNSLTEYIQREGITPVMSGKASTQNGKGSWLLKFKENRSWGRYYLQVYDPMSGHSTGKIFYVSYPNWWDDNRKNSTGSASQLTFYPEKESYNVGESVTLILPSMGDGMALVSLENGSQVLKTFWSRTTKGDNRIRFTANSKMAPNIFAHIVLVQPFANKKNDLPIRLYGVVPIQIKDASKVLKPIIRVDKNLKPLSPVVIKISEQRGRAMNFTVAVVDEGLLDLTNYKTPNPFSWFYRREALGIRTWDIYDRLATPLTGRLGKIFTIGGGGDCEEAREREEQKRKANRFEPVAKFFGPFRLNAGATKTVQFDMPRYIGSVKTMVVAEKDGAYGNSEEVSLVKEPVMLLPTIPRVLGIDEKVLIPVNVFAMEQGIGTVKIKLKTNDLLEVKGRSEKSLAFKNEGDKMIYYELETKEGIGVGNISFVVNYKGKSITIDKEIDIIPKNPEIRRNETIVLKPKESKTFSVFFNAVKGTGQFSVEAALVPPIRLGDRLEYLIRYPHGCLEQTVSSVFPQLFLEDLAQISESEKNQIQENVNAGLERLNKYKADDGGLGYWPGYRTSSKWATIYATYFILEAESRGFFVDGGLKKRLIDYLKREVQRSVTSEYEYFMAAEMLFLLAKDGKSEIGAMNRLKEKKLRPKTKWILASAYALSGNKKQAESLFKARDIKVADYSVDYRTYGTPLRDKAIILEMTTYLEEFELGYSLFEEIATALNKKRWYSTQTTAWALMSLSRYSRAMRKDENKIKLTQKIGNGVSEKIKTENFTHLVKTKKMEDSITITNNGKGNLFLSATTVGIPIKYEFKAESKLLSMNVVYKDQDGGRISNLSKVKQGSDIFIETTITNNGKIGRIENIALTQIFPSGWEILNMRLNNMQNFVEQTRADYKDIRDDRVLTYFSLREGKSATFVTLVNVAYPGEFLLPGFNCQPMYDDRAYVSTKGETVKIVPSKD